MTRIKNTNYANAAGLNPTTAVQNKWILYLPFKNVLGDAFQNMELQATQFYLPSINVGVNVASYQGYSIKIPANKLLNAGDKSLKVQYIVDDTWRNYTSLYAWSSKFAVFGDAVDRDSLTMQYVKAANDFATIRLWLLSPFKKKIVEFEFYDCWIESFGEILLDCTSSNPIKHDFTVSYSHFTIINDAEILDSPITNIKAVNDQ